MSPFASRDGQSLTKWPGYEKGLNGERRNDTVTHLVAKLAHIVLRRFAPFWAVVDKVVGRVASSAFISRGRLSRFTLLDCTNNENEAMKDKPRHTYLAALLYRLLDVVPKDKVPWTIFNLPFLRPWCRAVERV